MNEKRELEFIEKWEIRKKEKERSKKKMCVNKKTTNLKTIKSV